MKLTKTLALAALLLPSAALAQARPRYEFGVDAAIAYYSQGDQDLGGGFEIDGSSGIRMLTPVDVRVGFLSPSELTFEPRATLNFTSVSDEGSLLLFTPTLNVLYQAGKRTVVQRGMYFTGGLGLQIARVRNEETDDSETFTQPVVNFGVGTRNSINQGAFRPEGFVSYAFETDDAPSMMQLGVRLGLSFWK